MRWSGLARLPTPHAQIQERLGGLERLPVDDARVLLWIHGIPMRDVADVDRVAQHLMKHAATSGTPPWASPALLIHRFEVTPRVLSSATSVLTDLVSR